MLSNFERWQKIYILLKFCCVSKVLLNYVWVWINGVSEHYKIVLSTVYLHLNYLYRHAVVCLPGIRNSAVLHVWCHIGLRVSWIPFSSQQRSFDDMCFGFVRLFGNTSRFVQFAMMETKSTGKVNRMPMTKDVRPY